MANFYMTLPADEIARQVADLLNANNRLRKVHSAKTILKGAAAYFVDIIGGVVVGCSAIHNESKEVTRQFHLCVHPDYRRRGIARKLKLASLSHVNTPYVYITIREDNVASINLNVSLGFALIKKEWAGDHHVLTLGRLTSDERGQTRPDTVDVTEALHRPSFGNAQSGTVQPAELFYTGN
jgi:GNAT superfamily N-acetyltransferase